MIGKLIVHAPDRDQAIARMQEALRQFRIGPMKTSISLHRRLLDRPEFKTADFDIKWVEHWLSENSGA